MTIELLGWTLNGGGKGPVITVEEGGKLTIEDASSNGNGKITGGEADNGGGIYVDGGTVTMTGGAISGNKAKSGGGVYLTNGATFTMTGEKSPKIRSTYSINRGYGRRCVCRTPTALSPWTLPIKTILQKSAKIMARNTDMISMRAAVFTFPAQTAGSFWMRL